MRYQTTLRPVGSIVVLWALSGALFADPLADDDLDRVAGEVELLPQAALDKSLPGDRQSGAGEQHESRRGGLRLGGVQHLGVFAADAGRRRPLLGLVDQVVQRGGRNPPLAGF